MSTIAQAYCLHLCRFSDAGIDERATRSCGRRRKSAKARNRGKKGTGGAAGAMGIWPWRTGRGGWIEAVVAIALGRSTGVWDGGAERTARCATRIDVGMRG